MKEENKLEAPVPTEPDPTVIADRVTPSRVCPEDGDFGPIEREGAHIVDDVYVQVYGLGSDLPALLRTPEGYYCSVKMEPVVRKADPEFAREKIREAIARLGRVQDLDGAGEARRQELMGYLRDLGGR
jgi:hypothetical protein